MWETIQYVSSGFTLAAFIAAVVAWVIKSRSEQRERLIATAPEEERGKLVSDALEFFHVDTGNLTKTQQYQLAREQIRARAQRFKLVAVTVCVLALIAAVIAGYALSRKGESGGEVQALLEEAQIKLQGRNFAEAWRLGEKAIARSPGAKLATEAQVQVAMTWLRSTGLTQELSDVLEEIIARLRRASTTAKGEALATLRAHIGWAISIGDRDDGSPESEFKEAVKADASNAFAHAMWGYWLVMQAEKTKEGLSHLDTALKTGREKDFVRGLFINISRRLGSHDESVELVKELNNVRTRNEVWPLWCRERIFTGLYGDTSGETPKRHGSAMPAADVLATFQWLTTEIKSNHKDLITAQLMEAAGDQTGALALYQELLAKRATFSGRVEAGIKRIKQGKIDTK
jgi:hypothetical protein